MSMTSKNVCQNCVERCRTGVEQCRSVSKMCRTLTFDMHGASSHKLVSKWCRTRVERNRSYFCGTRTPGANEMQAERTRLNLAGRLQDSLPNIMYERFSRRVPIRARRKRSCSFAARVWKNVRVRRVPMKCKMY